LGQGRQLAPQQNDAGHAAGHPKHIGQVALAAVAHKNVLHACKAAKQKRER